MGATGEVHLLCGAPEKEPQKPADKYQKGLVCSSPRGHSVHSRFELTGRYFFFRVAFDFPRDASDLRARLMTAGFEISDLWEGQVVFRYDRPEQVLEHLLKSGAGTAFYEAIDPQRRSALADEFVALLADRCRRPAGYEVGHDYVACIARNGQ